MSFSLLLIQLVFVLLIAPFATGLVRWFNARFQGRQGASPFLVYTALLVMLKKEMVIRPGASFVFRMVPFVVLSTTMFLAMVIPIVTMALTRVDLFVVAGVLLLGAVFLVLGGLDSASAFGGMGASREMTISALVEPALVVTLVSLGVVTGTLFLDVAILSGTSVWEAPSLLLTIFALALCALAENARYPVDNSATHLELTMVHEAMVLEYSGPYLAMLEYASSIKLTLFALFLAHVIWPFGIASEVVLASVVTAVLLAIVKLVVAMGLLALLENLIAKMRFYRMQEFMTGAYFLALAGLVMALLPRL